MKKTFILFIGFLLITAAAPIEAPNFETIVLQQEKTIRKLTDRISDLNKEVVHWKQKAETSIEENRINAVSDEILAYYREAGYNDETNPFARDPAHLKKVFKYAEKYKYLLSAAAVEICNKGNIVPETFTMLWISEQTHFNPIIEYENKDILGRVISVDRTICQINSGSRLDKKTGLRYYTTEAWDHIYAGLPDQLKQKKVNPHKDVEIGVAMFYLWINERVRLKMPFAYAKSWTLYARLNAALLKFKKDG